jgi:general secretion pathway protein C
MFTSTYTPTVNTRGNAAIALWLCLLGSIGALGWTLYEDIATTRISPQAATNPSTQQVQSPVEPVNFSAVQLFGSASVQPTAVAQQDIPDTRLKLELKGAFSSSEASRASALVSEKGKTAKRYYVNESLPGDAVLTQVNSDYITLSRGGQLEVLRFPKPISSDVTTPQSIAANNALPTRNNTNHSNANRNNATNSRTESIKERLMRLRQNKN